MLALTPDELWLAGGPGNTGLYVTRERAKSWERIELPAPKEIGLATHATYDVPTFVDLKHGFEPVTFTGPGFRGAAALFETADGGRTWGVDRILMNLSHVSGGRVVASCVANPIWVVRMSDSNILSINPRARARAWGNVSLVSPGKTQISFATPAEGWITTPNGHLSAARNPGPAATDITPESARLGMTLTPGATEMLPEFSKSSDLSYPASSVSARLEGKPIKYDAEHAGVNSDHSLSRPFPSTRGQFRVELRICGEAFHGQLL